MPVKNLKSIAEGWCEIGERMESFEMPARHIELMRYTFIAGASFMLEMINELGQPDVSDAEAVAYHARLQDELKQTVVGAMFKLAAESTQTSKLRH